MLTDQPMQGEEPAIEDGQEDEAEAMRRSIASMFEQAVLLSPALPDELRNLSQAVAEPNTMADLVAAHLQVTPEEKQRILETVPLLERQKGLLNILNKEVRVLELTSKVHEEVSSELSRSQRDHYLREQMKAIQRELGEFGDWEVELDNLRDRMAESGLPESAWPDPIEALIQDANDRPVLGRVRWRPPLGAPEAVTVAVSPAQVPAGGSEPAGRWLWHR